MDYKIIYAFRGWIGFVAFMDLGTAFRIFVEKRAFFGPYSNANAVANQFTVDGKCVDTLIHDYQKDIKKHSHSSCCHLI